MPLEDPWLSSIWPLVRPFLPAPPATVVEVGCGREGGFIPALLDDGYRVIGIDPVAPEGSSYVQAEYEQTDLPAPADAIVACTSLHHVGDLAVVVDKLAGDLKTDGICVVIEYDWEHFDQATAEWCFARLGSAAQDGWLERQRLRWLESGQPWERYFRGWAAEHGMHGGDAILAELDRKFEPIHHARGAFFFPELEQVTEAEELQAIDAGEIRPLRIDYAGRLPSAPAA